MYQIKLFLSTIVVLLSLDMLWIGVIANKLYNDSIGSLLKTANGALAPNWPAAFLVYVAIAVGIIYFSLPKADNNNLMALLWGALLGFVIYGVYDFTNYSLLINWPLKITLIDLVWGMTLCGVSTLIVNLINRWLTS